MVNKNLAILLISTILIPQTGFPPGDVIYLVGTGVPTVNCQTGRMYARTDVPGLYLCTATNTWTSLSSGGSSVPTGSILMIITGACPVGYTEVTSLDATFARATTTAHGNIGTTSGSDTVIPTGTNSAPTLTMNSYTPGGTNGTGTVTATGTINTPTITWPAGVPAFTGNSVSSNAVSAGTPAGTNDALTFTGSSGTILAATVSWPAGVPTNASESAHTHSVTAAGTNATGTVTPLGTIAWPAAVPIFTGSALATHAHELPWQIASTTTIRQIAVATYGTGTSQTATAVSAAGTANTTSAAVALSQAKSAGTPAGTEAWPASVPTLSGSSSVTSAEVFSGSAVTSAGGSAHTHTISWPAGVPTNGTTSFTPAGTINTPGFTGSALGTHSHTTTATGTNAWPVGVPTNSSLTFSGTSATTSAQTFTGSSATLTGSVAAPTFTGNSQDKKPAYTNVIYCQKS